MSNQKCNDYLHVIQMMVGITKSMITHVARHSFATLALVYDVPITDVSRMLGHKNLYTTQIYAKILNETVERHADEMADKMAERLSDDETYTKPDNKDQDSQRKDA